MITQLSKKWTKQDALKDAGQILHWFVVARRPSVYTGQVRMVAESINILIHHSPISEAMKPNDETNNANKHNMIKNLN